MKKNVNQCHHLTVDIVLEIHQAAIAKFGGSSGLRSLDLLESAVAAPQATFGGQSTYTDLIDLAAAYLYFLCSNHPFVDGNKRVALGACLVFLRLNGMIPSSDSDQWEKLTLDVAAGKLQRGESTGRLRDLMAEGI
ncbi:MAG: type II toxin-antitoxin system death-on-curing family toxin [Verrucomicrobiales bacterium]|nr:type II toxin-antitoxin system death-on-curing family toxin [Verrucomicrobiales bacterium]